MIVTQTLASFRDSFHSYGRSSQFSYDGLTAIYDHITDYEDEVGEQWELDVIGICCEYSEYEDFAEIQGVYPDLHDMADLENETFVIIAESTIIIRDY